MPQGLTGRNRDEPQHYLCLREERRIEKEERGGQRDREEDGEEKEGTNKMDQGGEEKGRAEFMRKENK